MSDGPTPDQLLAGNARERLAAARALQRSARGEDVAIIREALDKETIEWTRKALEAALARATQPAPRRPRRGRSAGAKPASPEADERELAAQIRDEAVQETASQLVHLLDPIIGSLRVHASREIPEYASSDTARALDRLAELVHSVGLLGQASAAPVLGEVNIAALVRTVAISEFAAHSDKIELLGPMELSWITDSRFVSLALGAALRNSIEATEGHGDQARILCEWAGDGDELVIRVSDSGPGLSDGTADPFEMGQSTKPGHPGLGLPIARHAVRSLDGTLELRNAEGRGAVFELRLRRASGAFGARTRR
jgi:signal transduction histidine kinase